MSNQLRVSADARLLTATGEPYVLFTSRGYQVALPVKDIHTSETGHLLLGAMSLSQGLREIEVRRGSICGAAFVVRKMTADKMAPYEVIEDK